MTRALPAPFGRYHLLDVINAGGMAEVFRAKMFGVQGFERLVAIKRILPHLAEDKQFVTMFVDEARISVELTNPHIVQVYELGSVDDDYYIAMEYVSGRDLRHLLKRVKECDEELPVPHVAYIGMCVCRALDHAHRKTGVTGERLGIVHRDVSPQNVLISYEGEVKVGDFGIARAEHRLSKTDTGEVKGKLAYLSPEQVENRKVDHRTDIYATGALLYEMTTGRRVIEGRDNLELIRQARNPKPPPPRHVNPDIPVQLENVILRALAVDPNERYPSAGEIGDDLQQFLISGSHIFGSPQLASFMRRHFANEVAQERRRLEQFKKVLTPSNVDTVELTPDTLVGFRNKHRRTVVFATSCDVPVLEDGSPDQPTARSGGRGDNGDRNESRQAHEPLPEAEPTIGRAPKRRWTAIGAVTLAAVGLTSLFLTVSGLLHTSVEEPTKRSRTKDGAQASRDRGATHPPHNASGGERPAVSLDEEPDSEANRADRAKDLEARLNAAVRAKGIIEGDMPALDIEMSGMRSSMRRSQYAEALAEGARAMKIVNRVRINDRFIADKLTRFNRRFDRAGENRPKLEDLSRQIAASVRRDELKTANRQLNQAFRLLRSGRP
ncbi:serine/threonine protein kinase [Myxococcota bacterium]